MKKVTEFTVERDHWLRGTDNGWLLNYKGDRCCVGFYAQACGLDDEAIMGCGPLREAAHDSTDPVQKAIFKLDDTKTMQTIYFTNDNSFLDDEERERKLTRLFKRLGIKVNFK